MWRYRESDRGAGNFFLMSCDLPYYAAIDWQVDVLSTPCPGGQWVPEGSGFKALGAIGPLKYTHLCVMCNTEVTAL